MGAALLLALALAGGGRFERVNSRTEQGRSDRGLMSSASYALFELAPASGAGMGEACACAAVTGAKGEALTFSRASVGSCIKGSTTSLANGDMVICAAGQPRVMPGGDGTGGLGLLVERSGTNVVTRSEALDNAAYADYTAGGAAAPVVTADAATSPTGTATADMLALPAAGFSESSGRSIAVLTVAAYSAQVYVRGVTGPGDIDLCIEQTVGATCSTCAYTATSWSPCTVQNVTSIAGGRVLVGHLGTLSGVEHLVASSVYVWGLDAKLGSVATSYVPTAGSAVARDADSAAMAVTLSTDTVSMAVTTAGTVAQVNAGWIALIGTGTTHWGLLGYASNSVNALYATTGLGSIACTPATTRRRWGWWTGTASAVGCDSSSTSLGARTGAVLTATGIQIGDYAGPGATATANGVYKQICLDSDPTRCR